MGGEGGAEEVQGLVDEVAAEVVEDAVAEGRGAFPGFRCRGGRGGDVPVEGGADVCWGGEGVGGEEVGEGEEVGVEAAVCLWVEVTLLLLTLKRNSSD